MLRASVFAIVAGLMLSACGSSNDDRGPEPAHPCPPAADGICEDRVATGAIAAAELEACKADELRGCATQHYFRSFPTKTLPECRSGGSTKAVNANVAAKLFKGGGLWDERVVEQTHGLQRYWSVHELWFYTDSVSTPVPYQHAMVGTRAELETALRNVGIDPNATYLTPAEEAIANKAIGEVMFRPLREMILGSQAPGRVNIFVIPSIAAPTLTGSLGVNGEIAGLGVSPTLFARIGESDPQYDLLTLIGLPPDFTPTLFVGSDTVRKYTSHPDNLVAHEVGHILGLVHQNSTGNLMTQGTPTHCRTIVTEQQIDDLSLPRLKHAEPGWLALARAPSRVLAALRAH